MMRLGLNKKDTLLLRCLGACLALSILLVGCNNSKNSNLPDNGLGAGDAGPYPKYAFAIYPDDKMILSYVINSDTGQFSAAHFADTEQTPGQLALDSSGQFLYVLNNDDNSVSQYRVGHDSSLTAITDPIVTGTTPVALVVTQNYVYVVNSGDNSVSQYSIGSDGSLSEITIAMATETLPVAIAVIDNYVYVVNQTDASVSQYSISETDGSLAQITTPISAGNKPAAIAIDSVGLNVYVVDQSGDKVFWYAIAKSDGSLVIAEPDNSVKVGSSPNTISVTPSGQFVYVGDADKNELYQFSIGSEGVLTPLSPSSESIGNQLFMDPTERFACITDLDSQNVFTVAILNSDGTLLPADSFSTGSIRNSSIPSAFVFKTDESPSESTGAYVYVANAEDFTISQYSVGFDASFTASSAIATGSTITPDQLTVDATGTYAYLLNKDDGTGSISQYRITEGMLAPLDPATVTLGFEPSAISLSENGRFAYVVDDNDSNLVQYSIKAGALTHVSIYVLAEQQLRDIAFHPSGDYAYIVTDSSGILQYSVNSNDGGLTALSPASITSDVSGTSLVAMGVHSSGKYAYVLDLDGATIGQESIYQYNINPVDGTLSLNSTKSGVAFPDSIIMDPLGDYLYVSSEDGVLQYSIDTTDGTLTEFGSNVSPGFPLIAIDSTGTYLYLVQQENNDAGSLLTYQLQNDGSLSSTGNDPVATGKGPTSVIGW